MSTADNMQSKKPITIQQRNDSLRLLCVSGVDEKPGFAFQLEDEGWTVDTTIICGSKLKRIFSTFFLRNVKSYDIVATNEYFLSWAMSVRLIASRNPRLVALSFNQSSKIILSGFAPLDWVFNRVWRRIAKFLVHSKAEAILFAELHDIPRDRFAFSHWGYDLPEHNPEETQIPAEPYVAMVGRNNRDLVSFCAAVELAGIKGVLITSEYMLNDFASENYPNVRILADRPMEECLNYVAGSFAHLVLVSDDLRGAGHISAVSAMLLSKPQIFSHVATLSDYLITDFNGIGVGIGDVKAIAEAICKLQNEPEFAARLGGSGKNFALDLMTHAQSTTRCAEAVKSAYDVY